MKPHVTNEKNTRLEGSSSLLVRVVCFSEVRSRFREGGSNTKNSISSFKLLFQLHAWSNGEFSVTSREFSCFTGGLGLLASKIGMGGGGG